MGILGHRVILLLFCIGNLALQPETACGLTSIDLALRWRHPGHQNSRFLKGVAVDELQGTSLSLAPGPSVMFDPNQSNKRTVKKGSDPIHNRQ
ncbi:unnamed protein product [Linum trigynum]|uniref:Uncharacterized protein n=1 Tax=Linum trigynum TaxID=586398 RepID=A0AAV2D622_9ROSI